MSIPRQTRIFTQFYRAPHHVRNIRRPELATRGQTHHEAMVTPTYTHTFTPKRLQLLGLDEVALRTGATLLILIIIIIFIIIINIKYIILIILITIRLLLRLSPLSLSSL